MPKGGRRPGAGRKPGTVTKKTREIADKMHKEGITPLEVMVEAMRAAYQDWRGANELTAEERAKMATVAVLAAEKAAPYMHARLAAIEHSGEVSNFVMEIPASLDSADQWEQETTSSLSGGRNMAPKLHS